MFSEAMITRLNYQMGDLLNNKIYEIAVNEVYSEKELTVKEFGPVGDPITAFPEMRLFGKAKIKDILPKLNYYEDGYLNAVSFDIYESGEYERGLNLDEVIEKLKSDGKYNEVKSQAMSEIQLEFQNIIKRMSENE